MRMRFHGGSLSMDAAGTRRGLEARIKSESLTLAELERRVSAQADEAGPAQYYAGEAAKIRAMNERNGRFWGRFRKGR